jgi:hypothetical protein
MLVGLELICPAQDLIVQPQFGVVVNGASLQVLLMLLSLAYHAIGPLTRSSPSSPIQIADERAEDHERGNDRGCFDAGDMCSSTATM